MTKPTAITLRILLLLQGYIESGVKGAPARVAERLGISKQYVHQIMLRFPQRVPEKPPPDPKYFVCRICECEAPVSMRKFGTHVCRDCHENKIVACSCGVRFIHGITGSNRYQCPDCNKKSVARCQKKIIATGGPKADRLRAQRSASINRWQKKLIGEKKEKFLSQHRAYAKKQYQRRKLLAALNNSYSINYVPSN